MSVREILNRNPVLATGSALVIVLVAVIVAYFSYKSSAVEAVSPITQVYYSNDDGKSWFADSIAKVPPFDKDGKEADLAYVYQCPDGKRFVAYLQRYTPEGKKNLDAARAHWTPSGGMLPNVSSQQTEVKKPSQSQWTNGADQAAIAIMTLRCPAGGYPDAVRP